jgi:hypothetical protein
MVTCAQAIDSMIVPLGGQGTLRPFPAMVRTGSVPVLAARIPITW